MKVKRRHERFIRRLEIEFAAHGLSHRGISSNFSLGGLFLRTNCAFTPGTIVDLLIHLPDGTSAKAKGTVRMAMKTPVSSIKNGMGIEIIEKDSNYISFVQSISSESGADGTVPESSRPSAAPETPEPANTDFFIVQCPQCGVKNKVRMSRGSPGLKCGKCGAALNTV